MKNTLKLKVNMVKWLSVLSLKLHCMRIGVSCLIVPYTCQLV